MSKTDDFEGVAKELARANEKLRRYEKQIRGYKGLLGRREQGVNGEKPPISDTEQTKTTESATPPHYVGAWEKFCPECGVENPEFKDETKCRTCNMHLGSVETAEKMKACPNCGGVKVDKIVKSGA